MKFKSFFFWIFVIFLAPTPIIAAEDECQKLAVKKELQNSSQILMVSPISKDQAWLYACQRKGLHWQQMFPPFKAVLGKNGLALPGQKKEGDLKTPVGLYALGPLFGTKPLAVKMDYQYITADDKFIDDPHHKAYNTWVHGTTDAKSFETMLIKPYEAGAVIQYNMNPVKSGAGSAIFLHIWDSPSTPTVGCVALSRENVLTILKWLDKAQHPLIHIEAKVN